MRYVDPDGRDIRDQTRTSQYSASPEKKLGNSNLSLPENACTLTTYVRMAEVFGYKNGIDEANDVAIRNNLYTNGCELTVENGAKLATILIGNATIAITHDSSVSGSVMEMAVALNGKENSSSNYFATLRLSTSSKDGKEIYEHSLSINSGSIFINDITNISDALGFYYNDTSTANRTGTDDKTRLNKPLRLDFFRIEYQNWAMLENAY